MFYKLIVIRHYMLCKLYCLSLYTGSNLLTLRLNKNYIGTYQNHYMFRIFHLYSHPIRSPTFAQYQNPNNGHKTFLPPRRNRCIDLCQFLHTWSKLIRHCPRMFDKKLYLLHHRCRKWNYKMLACRKGILSIKFGVLNGAYFELNDDTNEIPVILFA